MKQFFSLVAAGIIGGLFVFGAINLTQDAPIVAQLNESPAVFVNEVVNQPFDFVHASKKAVPAVVHITAKESKILANQRRQDQGRNNRSRSMFEDFFGMQDLFMPKNGTGSGVIISEDGYIVTNNHVVGFADDIEVELNSGRKFSAELIGTDPSSDLAVLKVQAHGLPTMSFGDSESLKVGEWVLAVGNPFSNLESTVTAGILSAKGRDLDIIEGEKTIEQFLQTDAAVNPGNSGGALVDTDGNLIGINTAIASPTGVFAGYSFAIPINLAKRIIDDIKENGFIERANLGIEGYDISPELVAEKKLKVDKGIYVMNAIQGSGAQFAGIIPGDIVVKANGQAVERFDDIRTVMQFSKVGDTVDLEILRKGKKMTIPVKIKKRT